MKEFVTGGAAAVTASTLTHPLDLVKVRAFLLGEQARPITKSSLFSRIVAREGVTGLYSGVSATIARQACFSTARFGLYFDFKNRLGERPDKPLPYHRKVVATMSAGSIAALAACPADVVLVRMQADGRLPKEMQRGYRHVFSGMVRMARHEGLLSLYRGSGPMVLRGLLVTTGQFATYDQTKEKLLSIGYKNNVATHFIAGGFAGLVATCCSCPVDVIKSRMMNSMPLPSTGKISRFPRYASSWDCLRQTVRNEGMLALYKGFVPTYMRIGPQVMIMWLAIENFRNLWDRLSTSQRRDQLKQVALN